MSLSFHRHSWQTTGHQYNSSRLTEFESKSGPDPALLLKVIYGITNITQTCQVCGQVRVETAPGKVDPS